MWAALILVVVAIAARRSSLPRCASVRLPAQRAPACPAAVDWLAERGAEPRRLRPGRLLVVEKQQRRIALYAAGLLQGCWPVALAPRRRPGPKQRAGDLATPEGWYRTLDKPWSRFPGAIAISYPGVEDARRALAERRIDPVTYRRILQAHVTGRWPPQDTPLGGDILIHGGGSARDWTLGCIALADPDLADLRRRLPRDMRTDLLILP